MKPVLSYRMTRRATFGLLALAAAPVRRFGLAQSSSMTIIVGGLDSREDGQPENSDVLMIARLDLDNYQLRVVNIPRDLYCEIPGFGYDKITRAYDFGSKADGGAFKAGATAMKDTVSANFGIDADGVVLTTFAGYQQIVDAFGGVDVDNPYEVYDGEYPTLDYGYSEIYFPAGEIHLSGEEALEFSRTRHQDGDPGRVMRQHLVLRAMLDKANSDDYAPMLTDMVNTYRKTVRTDIPKADRLALAADVPKFSNDQVEFADINDYIWDDYTDSGMWIYSGDWSQIPGYVSGILDGSISGQ